MVPLFFCNISNELFNVIVFSSLVPINGLYSTKSNPIILLSSTLIYAQNKELITKTFYNQNINDITKVASENGYERKERIFILDRA